MGEVLVAAHDNHAALAAQELDRQAGDQIVCLEAPLFEDRQAERSRHPCTELELRFEIVGRLPAVGLVARLDFIAETLHRFIEADRRVGHAGFREQPDQCIRKTVGRLRRHAVRGEHLGQRVIGAKDVDVTVDQVDDGLGAH